MRITFLSVNSSFSHTSMAYHLLKGYCDDKQEHEWQMVECATKEKVELVLKRLVASNPQMLLASCYIFNHKELFEILKRFVLIRPDVRVILGGPEFLGNNEKILRDHPWIDMVVRGEGEIPLKATFAGKKRDYIRGICWIDEESRYRDNDTADLAPLDEVSAHYSKLFDERRPFVQYETSRGCPNRCSFCTSSLDPVLRFLPLEDVRNHLKLIEATGIPEVRILDRTFNIKSSRTLELMRMFREEFPSLRFHCEVDPALVNDKFEEALRLAPKGQMHIETGLQTFSSDTYDTVQRRSSMDKTVSGLQTLCAMENIEIHGDLIGGLPGATIASQRNDLLTLMALRPEEIQLENLKLLPGTPMCEFSEIVASPTPPYEVLRTATMDYGDLIQVSEWSRMIDWFYNYKPLQDTFALCCLEDCPDFFISFHKYLEELDAFAQPKSPQKRFQFLRDYLQVLVQSSSEEVKILANKALNVLAISWYLSGFSPERGLFPSKLFREDFPTDAKLLNGSDKIDSYRKIFHYQNVDFQILVAYGKGQHNASDTQISIWEMSC